MSREAFEEKYAQSWADTPPHVRKLWLEAWQAATSLQAERVRELEGVLAHIIEYWNRDANEQAMHDALWHIIETAEQALSATAREDV
jgi:hypothetical protein